MPRLTTLRPRLATLNTSRLSTPARSQRILGDTWMRIRDRILTRDTGRCRCRECTETGRLRLASIVDHRTPLALGGSNDDANLYAINAECHAAKSAAEAAERAGTQPTGHDAAWWRELGASRTAQERAATRVMQTMAEPTIAQPTAKQAARRAPSERDGEGVGGIESLGSARY